MNNEKEFINTIVSKLKKIEEEVLMYRHDTVDSDKLIKVNIQLLNVCHDIEVINI